MDTETGEWRDTTMPNMSYCRFENTLADLRDCRDAMDETDLSKWEAKCRAKLIKLCTEIAQDYGDMDK
jgi:hypothetical protein